MLCVIDVALIITKFKINRLTKEVVVQINLQFCVYDVDIVA